MNTYGEGYYNQSLVWFCFEDPYSPSAIVERVQKETVFFFFY